MNNTQPEEEEESEIERELREHPEVPPTPEEQRVMALNIKRLREQERDGTVAFVSVQAFAKASAAVTRVLTMMGVDELFLRLALGRIARDCAAEEDRLRKPGSFVQCMAAARGSNYLDRMPPLVEVKARPVRSPTPSAANDKTAAPSSCVEAHHG